MKFLMVKGQFEMIYYLKGEGQNMNVCFFLSSLFLFYSSGGACPLCPPLWIRLCVCSECGKAEDTADHAFEECSKINSIILGNSIIMEKQERTLVTGNKEHFSALHVCRNTHPTRFESSQYSSSGVIRYEE